MRQQPITVCFPFIGDEIGGSHISALKLVEALPPEKVRPIIALQRRDGPLARYLAARRLPYTFVPHPHLLKTDTLLGRMKAGFDCLRQAVPLATFLRDHEVDIVHTNDGRIHAQWAMPARLAGAAHVWHHRGDPDARGANLLAPLVADHMVTVSRFARPRRPIMSLQRKLSVVHSPFEPPAATLSRPTARAMVMHVLRCEHNTRFLGYFGLLIERKRPLAFVEVVAAFCRRHPDIPVMGLLFGVPGSESPHYDRLVLERAQALGISSRIRLMGFREPVDPWMTAMDVLLVPAVREPFGRTLIEAMFIGTPVVATNDGGNSEAIEHGKTGILVPPDQPEAFVAPIHRLLADEAHRQRITEEARARAYASYSVKAHVDKLTAIYQALRPGRDENALTPAWGAQHDTR
ncbi:glycosyltransferase family 4 protein [Rhodoligotrophos defluvii]|uniref:glycosyltransferase family 4 protein n=1 Tax=Rhodoligotrophos defluvii TaxID=2561934 RepID=UPI0010C9B1D9|nr:glycosyltransferase family 4 protein [Rhodoligotrophos defluvii]